MANLTPRMGNRDGDLDRLFEEKNIKFKVYGSQGSAQTQALEKKHRLT